MDSAQFPVKSRLGKAKPISEPTGAKIIPKSRIVPPSGKRVFGIARNPNIPTKAAPEKPVKEKPPFRVLTKAPETRNPSLHGTVALEAKNAKNATKRRIKSVNFQPKVPAETGKCSSQGDSVEIIRTPSVKVATVKAKPGAATPYLTAEKCSKCRFDKLETSSHWLGQIRLAESVGKHFVSSAFFRLALDCKAEPIRNICEELKKYVARHDYLNEEDDWKKLLQSYGLVNGITNGEKEKKVDDSEKNKTEEDDNDEDLNISCHGFCTKESQKPEGIQLFK